MKERFGIRLDKQYFNFGSAHFLIFADGTREELHGHNYRATLEIDGDLDAGHVVADFIEVKPIFKACCDELDHRTIFPSQNPHLRIEIRDDGVHAFYLNDHYLVPIRDVKILEIANTSSELLARWLCERLLQQISVRLPELKIARVLVTVQESPGQSAVYERNFAPG